MQHVIMCRFLSRTCNVNPSSLSSVPPFLLHSPRFFPHLPLTTSKPALGLLCILHSEIVMNTFDTCEGILKDIDILNHYRGTYEDRYSLPAVCVQRSVKAAAWKERFVITDGKYRAEELLWAD